MAACSSSPRTATICAAVALTIVMIAALLSSGCVEQTGQSQSTANLTHPAAVNISEVSGVHAPAPTTCELLFSQPENGTLSLISGYPFRYNGTVPDPTISVVRIWIFGEKTVLITSVPVLSGSFNFSLTSEQTTAMNGNYRIIFQYPKSGDKFEIVPRIDQNHQEVLDKQGRSILDLGTIPHLAMNGFERADILEREFQKAGVDDFSTNLSIIMEPPVVMFDRVGNHTLGETLALHGETNLPVGDKLEILVGLSGRCGLRYSEENSVYVCGDHIPEIVQIKADSCGNHVWEREVNTSEHGFIAGEYEAEASAVNVAGTSSSLFTLYPSTNPSMTNISEDTP